NGVLNRDVATGNTIGGIDSHGDAAGNVIGFNGSDGVLITGSGAAGDVLRNNFIGTGFVGSNLGNSGGGVDIQSGATDNIVGGQDFPGEKGIGYNHQNGVQFTGTGTSRNTALNNWIGTNRELEDVGNRGAGVLIADNASGNTIGGGNLIAFNEQGGVGITNASGNTVEENFIG